MQEFTWKELLARLTSRKFVLTVITFLLFVFSDKLGIDEETKRQILATFLGFVGVEGLADIVSRFDK